MRLFSVIFIFYLHNAQITVIIRKGYTIITVCKRSATYGYGTGNVLAVVSDKRDASNQAEVISATDYYPFGMTLPGRSYSMHADGYRFGFTGHERESELATGYYSTQTRLLDTRIAMWRGVDELYTKYPSLSSYNYCAGNPVVYIDPDGRWVESAWDLFNIGIGVASLSDNVASGNIGAAVVDGVGIIVDAVALALPFVPAGAGAAIKATRAADKVVDATKVADKAGDAGKAVGKYSDVPNPKNIGEGKSTTRTQRKNILEENKRQNNGELRSDGDGRKLNQPSRNMKGQRADMNQAEVDHINPKSRGGSNDSSNMQVLDRKSVV